MTDAVPAIIIIIITTNNTNTISSGACRHHSHLAHDKESMDTSIIVAEINPDQMEYLKVQLVESFPLLYSIELLPSLRGKRLYRI